MRHAQSYVTSALRVFDLSLGQMLWSRRSIFMALVVGAPVLIALAVRVVVGLAGNLQVGGGQVMGPAIFGGIIWGIYLRFAVPILAVFYGTGLLADEVEDRTITYLFSRPIPRGAVMLGKYLAYLACTVMVVLPSVMLVFLLIIPVGGGRIAAAFPDLVTDLALLALGLAVYGAVFALVGAWFKRPLVVGLLFLFAWEPVILVVPGYLKRLTVMYYLQALVPHAMPQDGAISFLQSLFRDIPSLPVALGALTLILVGFLALATRVVERREYVLEQ